MHYLVGAMGRRQLLQGGTFTLLTGTGAEAEATSAGIRVVIDAGLENQTILNLIESQGYLAALGLSQKLVIVDTPMATLKALIDDQADLCVTSASNSVLPEIAKGAPIRVVGAAMQRVALAVCSARPDITDIAGLAGRRIGVGPQDGLLAVLMRSLLYAKGIDWRGMTFVDCGSNKDVFHEVKTGSVDAGLADIADLGTDKAAEVHPLRGGEVWNALPAYPYQLSYASQRALARNRQGIILALAAYGRLFRYLSTAQSWTAYEAARRAAGGDDAGARAMWHFIQTVQPYQGSPVVSGAQLDALQMINVKWGLQQAVLPESQMAELSVASSAIKLI